VAVLTLHPSLLVDVVQISTGQVAGDIGLHNMAGATELAPECWKDVPRTSQRQRELAITNTARLAPILIFKPVDFFADENIRCDFSRAIESF